MDQAPRPRHLKKAPISEAIIDFRVQAREDFDAREFEQAKKALRSSFPKIEPRLSRTATFKLDSQKPLVSEATDPLLQGLWFKSEDELNIAQFRIDGFTFNRLKPYTSWEAIFPQALDLWERYSKIAKPIVVTRLALRYINKFELPPGLVELDEFLTAGPKVPNGLPQNIGGFLSRLTIDNVDDRMVANVGQAMELDHEKRLITLILDIDTFTKQEFPVDSQEIETTFEKLRTFKNDIFFKSLTPKQINKFEPE